MHPNEEAPPLSPWPFLISDAILLGTAALIASQTQTTLNGGPLIAVVCCVSLGAVLAVIPFILNHTRRQDAALAERQREISALAQTTASSAEQISIAVSNFHSITETTTRGLKLAEVLPHKLQEKINDFKAQLNEVAVTENESLAQEVNTLRSSETERLETALAAIRKTAAEITSVEAATRKHLSELNEALTRFSEKAEKAVSEASKQLGTTRIEAEKALAASQTAVLTSIRESVTKAIAEIDQKFSSLSAQLPKQLQPAKPPEPAVVVPKEPSRSPFVEHATLAVAANSAPQAGVIEKPAEIAEPVAAVSTLPEPPSTEPAAEDVVTTVLEREKPARKRASRKPISTDNELSLGLDAETSSEFSQLAPEENLPAVSADGLTRLLVTAYIGIGNKLFVRGEGPGLSWERGVPLQFVSIGKWRWESSDATAAVSLKLYKNDEVECVATGLVTLEPGHQREVTASFN
ncbi:MAG: hypothetical protein QM790_13175 [Nibricoccus sp.]